MKTCTKCKKSFDYSFFHKDKTSKDGLVSQCKECVKSRHTKEEIQKMNKKYRASKYSKDWSVYILPKENYAGMTQSVFFRMHHHKSKGKDITGYRVIEKTKTKAQARELEDLLHDIGYKGGWKKS